MSNSGPHPNYVSFPVGDESCTIRQSSNKPRNKKTENYLEDVLRYTNATPIGDVTPNGIKCCYCRDQYDSPANLKHHTLDKHAKKVIVWTTKDYVKLDITGLTCLDCYVEVYSLQGFVRHMQVEHRMVPRTTINYPIVPFKFDSHVMKCALCQRKFKNFDSLVKHVDKHFENHGKLNVLQHKGSYEEKDKNEEEFDYSGNEYVYDNSENGDKYENSDKWLNLDNSDIWIKYENSENGERYESSDNSFEDSKFEFEKHENEFEGNSDEWIKCLYCDLEFKNQTDQSVHMTRCHLKVPVNCEHYDSKFLNKKDLSEHITVKHRREAP